MENPPFEDVFPIGKGEFPLSIAMLVYWRVYVFNILVIIIWVSDKIMAKVVQNLHNR